MNRQYITVLAQELARHGISRWHVDRRHRHPRLVFEWQGRPMFFVMAGTASDWRSVRNHRADLRRLLNAGSMVGAARALIFQNAASPIRQPDRMASPREIPARVVRIRTG
jgi:hypothetical protein